MHQQDVDKLLSRRLYLQRYVTSVFNDILDDNAASDKQLVAALGEFVLDADAKTLAALSQQRTRNPAARGILNETRRIVRDQRDAANDRMAAEIPELVAREITYTSGVLNETPPSSAGVASLPVAGTLPKNLINAAFALYGTRLISEITQAAATGPANITRLVRGARAEKFKDGLFWWRNNKLIRPNVEMIVNGAASNASNKSYVSAGVEYVDYLATLDFKTCARCAAAEAGSPYRTGTAPVPQLHPGCRCVLRPSTDVAPVRPYVKDDRSVKDIPKSERDGKIGQTRDTIDQFLDRMSHKDRVRYMGPTRAELWRQGKIDDVRDLVNQRTLRPLRLDELPSP